MTKSEEELQNKFAWKAELKKKIEGIRKDINKCECSACEYDYDLNCYSDTHNEALDDVLKLLEDNV